MKAIGSILLATGFLFGAYLTVAQVERVDWTRYGICAGLMLVAVVLLYLDRSSISAEDGERHREDLGVLEASLASLIERLEGLLMDASDQAQLGIHGRIDAELLEDINTFVEARESMIPRLGMQSYADIMSPFANGERLLNRAWSASADGYVDEVRTCVGAARSELERAQRLLGEARAASAT